LDLTTSDGSNGFAEIGVGTSIVNAPTSSMKMSISPDGGILFIVANDQVTVQPVP